MKKLYKKSTVHPSPPLISDHHLAFLPAAIFTLTVALSPQDKEVLAYLISSSTNKKTTTTNSSSTAGDHPPLFNCSCFRCYMSYWVRWDSSPNRQLIHEIIDAFEDGLVQKKSKKDRKKKVNNHGNGIRSTMAATESAELTRSPELAELDESEPVADGRTAAAGGGEEEGSVRKLVSFLGQRIWSVWT